MFYETIMMEREIMKIMIMIMISNG